MFNNILYFIVVLLIFNIGYPVTPPEESMLFTAAMLFLSWLIFSLYCSSAFVRLLKLSDAAEGHEGRLAERYQRLNVRLSILAIFFFALAVCVFNLKQWLYLIPLVRNSSLLQGTVALSLFFFYLITIWHIAYPAYAAAFQVGITRRSFILSNIRFNIPVLFPWAALSLVYDLLALTPWGGVDGIFEDLYGQMVFFTLFLTLLMIFMPGVIQYWWGCKPLSSSDRGRELERFLTEKGFRYRRLLKWPIFEGRMMTAGIMGIIPRYRYILMTDALMEVLSVDELKAVLAHEMGHAKYRHLLLYILFFVGYMVISFGFSDFFMYLFTLYPGFSEILTGGETSSVSLLYLVLSLPMLITLVVYFRYVMGFFMRNFERQADLYSAKVMGGASSIISSLEKIALFSGKSRDLPSWHHFSIGQRVDFLWRTVKEKTLLKKHNRFVLISFFVYFLSMCVLGYALNFGPVKEGMNYSILKKVLIERIKKEPDNLTIYYNLAMVSQQMGDDKEAIHYYDRIIERDHSQAGALNNLAWLLVTGKDTSPEELHRALNLARRAVELKPEPEFLDTLAEACFVNGNRDEAVRVIKRAIEKATSNRSYYEGQLKKFSENG